MQYFILPDGTCIARIHRAASRAIAKAIAMAFYPDLIPQAPDDNIWLSCCPQTEHPKGRIIALIREPVERFISAASMPGMNISEIISGLKDGTLNDPHFWRQSDYQASKIYTFPKIQAFCKDAGFPELETIADSNPKPLLAPEQAAFVQNYYATDVSLFKENL